MTRWLLNSAVLPAGEYGTYRYSPATREELSAFLSRGVARIPCPTLAGEYLREDLAVVVSRIGYEETAGVIERWTGVRPPLSWQTSAMQPGDVAFVVRLRYRVPRGTKGQAPQAPRPDSDWEIGRLERLAEEPAPIADLVALVRRIAATPCDHGPQEFCPREDARALLARMKGGAE